MLKTKEIQVVNRDQRRAKAVYAATYEEMLSGEEGLFWLDATRLGEKLDEAPVTCVNTAWGSAEELLSQYEVLAPWGAKSVAASRDAAAGAGRKRVNLLALGDVGATVLMGLKLLGGEVISQIGICDIDPNMCERWEREMNQTSYPWEYDNCPTVKIVGQEELFQCEVFVFCASCAVPPVGAVGQDVRMVQWEANRKILGNYARLAKKSGFRGLFAVVSDPVDPLCREVFLESNQGNDFDGKGLRPEQIQGYGLGVMNARAAYYAKKDMRFADFLSEGRAFGPHGADLVIANSIEHYDDELSKELTKLAAEANLQIRELGFKPYVAPALSSAAISILLTLKGQWHYSSTFLGGVYMGCKNRFGEKGLEIESLPLPEQLYRRLQHAYDGLEKIR